MQYKFSVEAAATEVVELAEGISEDQLLQELEAWVWDHVKCEMKKLSL